MRELSTALARVVARFADTISPRGSVVSCNPRMVESLSTLQAVVLVLADIAGARTLHTSALNQKVASGALFAWGHACFTLYTVWFSAELAGVDREPCPWWASITVSIRALSIGSAFCTNFSKPWGTKSAGRWVLLKAVKTRVLTVSFTSLSITRNMVAFETVDTTTGTRTLSTIFRTPDAISWTQEEIGGTRCTFILSVASSTGKLTFLAKAVRIFQISEFTDTTGAARKAFETVVRAEWAHWLMEVWRLKGSCPAEKAVRSIVRGAIITIQIAHGASIVVLEGEVAQARNANIRICLFTVATPVRTFYWLVSRFRDHETVIRGHAADSSRSWVAGAF